MSTVSECGALLTSVGTVGSTLFEGNMPDAPHNLVAIYERPGRAPVRAMAKTVICVQPHLDVRVRDLDYETGYAKARAIEVLLQNYSSSAILQITAMGAIHGSGMDENGRWVFAQTFLVMKSPS